MRTKKTSSKKSSSKEVKAPSRFYVGSMGEHYVMAELLARGYNVSRAVVDEGIDVIAFKSDNPQKLFRLQVKTAFPGAGGSKETKKYTFTLNTQSYERASGQDYYLVLVMRDNTDESFISAVIPKAIFDDYKDNSDVIEWTESGASMQIAVHFHNNGSLTLKNVGGTDITAQSKNRWNRIN